MMSEVDLVQLTSEITFVKPTGESFDVQVNRLFRELHRAVQWNRPSILLVVYRSEFVRADVAQMLTEKLYAIGQNVIPHHVKGSTNDDIPVHLVNHPDRSNTIFFVSGLRWGGGIDKHNAYRALNIRREYLVDERIRAVFWITDIEELSLPNYAPDFWAFRHRVVDFLEQPSIEQIQRTVSQILLSDFSEQGLREHNEYKIVLHESLMKDLRRYDELTVLRGKTLYILARLRQARGEHTRVLSLLQESLDIGKQANHSRLQSDCYLARGNIHNLYGHYDEAIADFQNVVELTPFNPSGYVSLGNVYLLSGRVDEAMALCIQALALDSNYAPAYTGIGKTLRTLRLPNASIEAYQIAISFDSQDSDPCVSLGNLYQEQKRYDEAIASYQQAIVRNPDDAHPYKELGDVYTFLGHSEKATEAYQQAALLEQEYQSHSIGQPQYDIYTSYEKGFEALLNQVDSNDPLYNDVITLGQRLKENIQTSRLSGDNENSRATRAEIFDELNKLSLTTTGKTFNELYQENTSLQTVRDRLSYYEDGLKDMLKKLGQNNPRYTEALVYEHRLRENIFTVRREEDSDERQSNRSQIIDCLNELARSELGLSFNDLCRQTASKQTPTPQDDYVRYERGLFELLTQLGTNHLRYGEALIYEQRLQENIAQSRMNGESVHRQSECAEILNQLNNLALDAVGISFAELCGMEQSATIQFAGDRFAHYEIGLHKLLEELAVLKEEDQILLITDPQMDYYIARLEANFYRVAIINEQRLRENIAHIRQYGDTYSKQRQRATVIGNLNNLKIHNGSFFDLCRQSFNESNDLDTDSSQVAQLVRLQKKRTVLEEAFEQQHETIKVLENERIVREVDPVRLSRIAQKLAEEYQQWVRTLLELEAVEKLVREIYAVATTGQQV